ncbi:hypothetical protein H0H93_015475, partial [Arthromyces matolae]
TAGSTIGDTEQIQVAWCTKSGRGARTIPNGALKGVHFVKTKNYVQVTGVGDFTKMNIKKGDEGGELDDRGADGRGNPSTTSSISVIYRGLLIIFLQLAVSFLATPSELELNITNGPASYLTMNSASVHVSVLTLP